jgi:NADH:ubiquinone oxidoreductase subunit 6 (subunit J)
MKWVIYVVSVAMVLAGSVFALQGLRLLPSRVMYGKPEWIVIGAIMVVVGVGLSVVTYWREKNPKAQNPNSK